MSVDHYFIHLRKQIFAKMGEIGAYSFFYFLKKMTKDMILKIKQSIWVN